MDLAGARLSWEEWDHGMRVGEPRAIEALHRLLEGMAKHSVNEELTERELEVLRLLAEGLMLSEVGKKLFISTETVKTHGKHINLKLGARNGTHAVVIAIRRGLIE